jgi:hypothetical protein
VPTKWIIFECDCSTRTRQRDTTQAILIIPSKAGGVGRSRLRQCVSIVVIRVFTPDELAEVYKTGMIGRSAGLNTNPSGTAAVTGEMQDVTHPERQSSHVRSHSTKDSCGAVLRGAGKAYRFHHWPEC